MSIHRYLKITTAAAAVAVSTANAKTHLRVTDSDSDTYIALLVALATRIYEERACTSLINQTLTLYLDRFPHDSSEGPIYLPRGPVSSITTVKYYDTAGVQQTLAAASYRLQAARDVATLKPAYGYAWPDVREQYDGAVEIAYVAGYGAAEANLPEMPLHAIKLLTAHFFERRESTSEDAVHEVPETFNALVNLDPHRYMPDQE